MKNLKNITAIIVTMITAFSSAFAGSTETKMNLNNLIVIAEDSEEPVREEFFYGGKNINPLDLSEMKTVAIEKEQPTEDIDFSAAKHSELLKLRVKAQMKNLEPILEEEENPAKDVAFMKS